MNKPTDREALAILATFAHEVMSNARIETVDLVRSAEVALKRSRLIEPSCVVALSEEPAREVEMMTYEELKNVCNAGPAPSIFFSSPAKWLPPIAQRIQRACAEKWGLTIKGLAN